MKKSILTIIVMLAFSFVHNIAIADVAPSDGAYIDNATYAYTADSGGVKAVPAIKQSQAQLFNYSGIDYSSYLSVKDAVAFGYRMAKASGDTEQVDSCASCHDESNEKLVPT